MSSEKAKGFAIRRNNTCHTGEQTCATTWGTWTACCPHNSYCPGKDKKYFNNICCPDSSNCTALITNPAICADNRWNLYAWNGKDETGGWFCCESNQQGFYVSGQAYVGCAGPGVEGNANFIDLAAKTTGTQSTVSTFITTTTSLSTSDSAITNPSNEPISSSQTANIGAIVGGVVGGIVGLAVIIAAAFFLLRHRKRQLSPQEMKSSKSGNLTSEHQQVEHSEQIVRPAELDPRARPAELIGNNDVAYELPGI